VATAARLGQADRPRTKWAGGASFLRGPEARESAGQRRAVLNVTEFLNWRRRALRKTRADPAPDD
jgi:hypothetical protein